MPLPVRSLPVLQNWDCRGCTACCRQYQVSVSAEEMSRIQAQGWEQEPDLRGLPLFVKSGGLFTSGGYRLNHKPDGACVFLGPDNRCRIHVKHGSAAKPLACRIYPFALVPAGDHWKLGLRFACPASAEGTGRPLAEQLPEAREYAAALEAGTVLAALTGPPPPLQGSQTVGWGDFNRIVVALSKVFTDTDDTMERRWRRVLFIVSTLRQAAVGEGGKDPSKAITAGRLSELLHILGQASDDEVPLDPVEVPAPGWVGRMVFRPVAALYARKDTGSDRGAAQASALGRLLSAVQFARGAGYIPRTHAAMPPALFADAEKPLGELSERAEELLERWTRVKLESGQFCGPSNFGMHVWDGLESLAVAFAAAMWLARVLIVDGRPIDDAVLQAVRIVDDNFGFNPLLGSSRQMFALRLLGKRGELPRLIAWYGR
jgi:lysine-N-methylase